MFKKSNLLFVILFISIFGFIGLLNYYTDPYDILHKDYKTLYCFNEKKELLKTIFYFSQKEKYEYLVVGSSTTNDFLNKDILKNKKTFFMTSQQFDFTSQVEYLEYVLKIHPEIKTIIFPIEYAFFPIDDSAKTPKINETKLNIKDILTLIFSRNTTTESIKKLFFWTTNIAQAKQELNERKRTKKQKYNIKTEEEIFFGTKEISIFTKRNYYYSYKGPFLETKFQSLERLKEILNKNDKEVIFIFPPYHALGQVIFYKANQHRYIKEIKRYIVNNFPNAKIYDFAFINKYTSEPLDKTDNYRDIMHPQGEPGHFFYCAFKNLDKFENEDLYVKLTPQNIDNTLKWQEERLKEYISKNQESINTFMKYNFSEWNSFITKKYKFPKDCNYYINNIR